MASASDVAAWMVEQVVKTGCLYQDEAVASIERIFGRNFVYDNDNGNPAIAKDVLRRFREATDQTVVWERGERLWRQRESYDQSDTRMTA